MTRGMDRDGGALRFNLREGLVYALLPVAITVALSAKILPGVLAGGLVNPDSYMRLVRLQDEIQRHDVGYLVARDGSGGGTLLHWSHLLDMLLCLIAAPFRLAMNWHDALHAAAVLFGPLCMAALGVALAWAVAPVAHRRWLWLTPAAVALAAAVTPYGLPGEAHHHVLLIVVAAMTAGYALRAALGLIRDGDGLAMGAWGGLGIWISPETMPLTLMAFGGLWLAWLLQPEGRRTRMIREAAVGLLLVVCGTYAVDPPYAGYASVEIDRISIVYVGLALAIGVAACAAAFVPDSGKRRMLIGLLVPAACLAAWLALFPIVARGTDGLMNAHDTQAMLGAIVEMLPVRGAAQAVEFLLTGTLIAAVLTWFGVSHRSVLVGYAALCACILVVLGALHVRFAAYPAAASAAMLPVLLDRCGTSLAGWPESARACVRVALMAIFVLVPCGVALPAANAAQRAGAASCDLANSTAMLADHAGQIVLSNPNSVPELLYRTRVLTVGSLYHRNVAAFMRLRAAWRSTPGDTVPAAVRATGATLILFCPSPTRSLLVADVPPATLLDRLNQGHVPAWLHKVSEDRLSGNVLYEVVP